MSSNSANNSNPAIAALLATGPVTVSLTTERELQNANPHKPAFLKGIVSNPDKPDEWFQFVLPYVSTLTFVIGSSADVEFVGQMFASPFLPRIYEAITKLGFTGFHWFSGIGNNRAHNPYFQVAKHLPHLSEILLTMHTAGITVSRYTEFEMVSMEATDPARSKERKALSCREVMEKYEMGALFECAALRTLRLKYIESEMTTFFTIEGNPTQVMAEVQATLAQGFLAKGRNVFVELSRAA